MQLIVDTASDGPANLRHAAAFLMMLAGEENVTPVTVPQVPEGTTPPPPPSNVLPFPPPPPPPPSVPAAATPPEGAGAPTVAAAVPSAPAASAPISTAVELDKAGLPWDARIHQSSHNKKKDGTWKIQKGADPALVETVVKELVARHSAVRAAVGAPLPSETRPTMTPEIAARIAAAAGNVPPPPPPASAPVSLPSALPVPPPVPANGVPSAPVPSPTTAAAGTFRALIDKILAASGPGKLSPLQVSQLVLAAGAPNLGALGKPEHAHLLPEVEVALDLAIAGFA